MSPVQIFGADVKDASAQEAVALHRKHLDQRKKTRELRVKRHGAIEEIRRINEAIIEAHAADDEQQAQKLAKELAKAQASEADLGRRVEGSARAEQRTEQAHMHYLEERFEELMQVLLPDALAAREGVERAMQGLSAAIEAWRQEAARFRELGQRKPGLDTYIPDHRVDQLERAVLQFGRNIPAPIPHQLVRDQEVVEAASHGGA